jgi:hypothetical protein
MTIRNGSRERATGDKLRAWHKHEASINWLKGDIETGEIILRDYIRPVGRISEA